MRRSVIGAGFCALALICATGAIAQPEALLVSGQTVGGIVDTDEDGPDAQDCSFSALFELVSSDMNLISGSLAINTAQTNSPSLRACDMQYFGSGNKGVDSSSNFLTAVIDDTTGGSAGSLPFFFDVYDETSNRNIANPVLINDPSDEAEFQENYVAAINNDAVLCSMGADISAVIRFGNAPNLIVDVNLFPDDTDPTHLQIPNLPMELTGGGFQFFNGYIPVNDDGHITLARSSAPDTLLLDINLATLPPCGAGSRAHGVPTLTLAGLIGLALGLLTLGTVVLSRRQSFARSVVF